MSLLHRFQREDAESETKASFDRFWSLFPRRVAKLEALKAWKQVTREYEPEEIIEGLRRNLPALERKERQFVKHPASWLRSGCWMDEPDDTSPRQPQRHESDLQRMSRELRERNARPRDHYAGDSEVVPLFSGQQGRR